MANPITKRARLSRRLFLKGLSAAQSPVIVGLPPLVSMFGVSATVLGATMLGTFTISLVLLLIGTAREKPRAA